MVPLLLGLAAPVCVFGCSVITVVVEAEWDQETSTTQLVGVGGSELEVGVDDEGPRRSSQLSF